MIGHDADDRGSERDHDRIKFRLNVKLRNKLIISLNCEIKFDSIGPRMGMGEGSL